MKRLLTFDNIRLLIEIVLIVVLVGVLIARPSLTTASPQAVESASLGATYWYQCVTPDQVAAFTTRVHVHCTSVTPLGAAPALPGVGWFAVSIADSATASRFMSIIQSAVLTTQPLYLFVDPTDTSGSTFGCGSGDCRRLYGVELLR